MVGGAGVGKREWQSQERGGVGGQQNTTFFLSADDDTPSNTLDTVSDGGCIIFDPIAVQLQCMMFPKKGEC